MARLDIAMPDVGEGVTEAEITEWQVSVGDLVREDDVLAAVMTDKATVEIPSPIDGTVAAINGNIGEVIAVGTTLVTLEVADAGGASTQADPAGQDEPPSDATPVNGTPKPVLAAPKAGKPMAAPAVRRRASEAGIDLAEIVGSGPDGRVTLADLEAWIETRDVAGAAAVGAPMPGDVEEIQVRGLRRKIAEHMQTASQRIAHMTYVEEVDVTDLEAAREQLNSETNGDQARLTILPCLMIAVIRALKKHRRLNAHYDDEAGLIRQFSSVHLGVATQTEAGLMVPVIANAETRSVAELAGEIARLADAARSGKIKREELTGSTITLSNLGAMGGLISTPIVNAPEVAIIGVNKIAVRPVWCDGNFVARKIINLSSSFDHRVVDGWDAAVFIQDVKSLIEDPAALLEET